MIPARNPWYRQALASPHGVVVRVEVWRDGVPVDELVAVPRDSGNQRGRPVFFGGSVRATLASRVTRTLGLSVPDYLFPWDPSDLLNPYGTELRVFRGIKYGNDSRDEFPVFVGLVQAAGGSKVGEIQVQATDNAGRVVAAGFASPTPASAGALVVDEVERLILEAYPAATFGTHDDISDTVPSGLSYDLDRGAALDALVKPARAFWYALADGRFVIRRVPWSSEPTRAPIPLADGPGGLLVSAFPDRNAAGLFNRITVTSDRPDGGIPFYATADDDDPTSPTWVGGPFGVRSTQVRLSGATSQQQCLTTAQSLIRRTRAVASGWAITMQPDASLELGDPLAVTYRGRRARQVAAGFTIPLGVDGTMPVDGRGYTDPALEDEAL